MMKNLERVKENMKTELLNYNFWKITAMITSALAFLLLIYICYMNVQLDTPKLRLIDPPKQQVSPTISNLQKDPIYEVEELNKEVDNLIIDEDLNINTGKFNGYIKHVFKEQNSYFAVIDRILFLRDDSNFTASTACLEDNECLPDWCEKNMACMPNGYYIRNRSGKVRIMKIDKNAIFEIQDSNPETVDVHSIESLYNIYNLKDSTNEWVITEPYEFEIINNSLRSVVRFYRP